MLYYFMIIKLVKIRKSSKCWWEYVEDGSFYTAGGRVGITIPEIHLTGSMQFINQQSCFKKYILRKLTQVYKSTCMRMFMSTMFGDSRFGDISKEIKELTGADVYNGMLCGNQWTRGTFTSGLGS